MHVSSPDWGFEGGRLEVPAFPADLLPALYIRKISGSTWLIPLICGELDP